MYCICWRSLKFGRGLKRRPWDSNSLHKFTIQPFVIKLTAGVVVFS